MKKLLRNLLVVSMSVVLLAGCGGTATPTPVPTPDPTQKQEEAPPAKTEEAKAPDNSIEGKYIAVVSKGFQHQYWQTVKAGSDDAAAKYGVKITFEGPPTESDIANQVEMINNALSKKPIAMCLAVLDTESVSQQLNQAKSAGIPIVGFDSGVPNAPEGVIVSTASTNNEEAGRLAAESMYEAPGLADKIKAATPDNPVVIAIASQDATSASIVDRTVGYIEGMVALCEVDHPGAVEVTGHDKFNKPSSSKAAVTLKVTVPPSSSYQDSQAAIQTILNNEKNLIGFFLSNESTVTGMLSATSDGVDLDREKGKYKDLIVVGFDAGSTQKNAVKNQYFYGSVTQDPYMIGYLAVELAAKSVMGEKVEEMVDTGCKFYTYENMDQSDIAILLYD